MTLHQIRIFLAVAAYEHVTKAAQKLNMTQSAVSAAISALEERYQVQLFDRIGRRIALTQSGKVFLEHANSLARLAGETERFLGELSGAISGPLHIQASQTVASYWLPQQLVRFREQYPRVQIDLSIGNTRTVSAAILDGSADIAIVEGKVENDNILQQTVATDRLALIVGQSHPWADGRAITAGDLHSTTWIMREPGSGTRAAFEEDVAMLGLDPNNLTTTLELPSNEACLAAVEVGRSATVLSQRAAFSRLNGGGLHQVNFEFPERHFTLLRHAERHPTNASRAMMNMLNETTISERGL